MSTVAPTSDAYAGATPAATRDPNAVAQTFRSNKLAMAAAIYLVLLVVVAILAPLVVPRDPAALDLTKVYKGPGDGGLLGTDNLGRDQLSRLIYGARTSLVASVEAVGISLLLGVPFGVVAGYRGGKLDTLFSRVNDALMSVPNLILALAMVAVLGPGLGNAMLAIGIVFTPRVFRVVRAAALEVRHNTFVEGLESVGLTRGRILVRHILPNVMSPLLVVVSVSFGNAVLAEAGLSFLGLGARPPTATWGGMLETALQRLDLTYLAVAPGVALFLTICAFTFVGDALRDALAARRSTDRG